MVIVGWKQHRVMQNLVQFCSQWILTLWGGPNQESTRCQAGTIEEFEKSKMAYKMAANLLNWL